jgi:regulator of sirC expression with transglutaminase-like and TPR domain
VTDPLSERAAREARDPFRELAGRPDARVDVATGALLIAAEHEPGVDVETALGELEQLAESVRPRLQSAVSDHDLVARLNECLFEELGFRGNRDDYYDPRNSFLNAVLERRTGIPITLCIVYVEVARRLALDAHGVGFPGHFLAKVVGEREIVVDAFDGLILTRDDCAARLRAGFGPQAELRPELLAPIGPRQILSRMLGNLKQIYLQQRRLEAAIACCDRILLLAPDSPLELRDRGLLHREIECFGPAADDLERFLLLAPGHETAEQIRTVLAALRERTARLH